MNSLITLAAGLSTVLLLTSSSTVAAHSSNPHLNSRRHHAKLAARQIKQNNDSHANSLHRKDISTVVSGLGQGTLYYDLNGGGTCGAVNGWTSFAETNGYGMCEPNAGFKTLAQRGSNRVVAMPSNMLSGRQSEYCGKEVVVTYKGKTVDNLVLWDGCAACNSNNGLDFSSTVFAEIFGEDNCDKGRIDGMSWKIIDNQLWDLNGNPVSGASNNDDTQDEPAPEPSSTWTPEATPSSSSYSSCSTSLWSESSSWIASTTKVEETKEAVESSIPAASSTWTNTKLTPVKTMKPDKWEAIALVPTSSESSSTEEAPASETQSESASETETASEIQQEQDSEPTPSPASSAPEPIETEESHVPAAPAVDDASSTEGGVCNETPGSWRCAGWSLQQCVQTQPDWTWSTRVSCRVAPINCDSPNPVCPQY